MRDRYFQLEVGESRVKRGNGVEGEDAHPPATASLVGLFPHCPFAWRRHRALHLVMIHDGGVCLPVPAPASPSSGTVSDPLSPVSALSLGPRSERGLQPNSVGSESDSTVRVDGVSHMVDTRRHLVIDKLWLSFLPCD